MTAAPAPIAAEPSQLPSLWGGGGGLGGDRGGGGGGGGREGGILGGGGDGAMIATISSVTGAIDKTGTPSAAERLAGFID